MPSANTILKKYFGYDSFRPGQEKIIESIMSGKDTFAVMPTGAGKSICYQVPAMMFPGITIVISPLISLMKDQVDSLSDSGIPASYINSSLSISEIQNKINGALNNKYKIIYAAPERLESIDFIELVSKLNVSFISIDEAHCVSQWGHDFRPGYLSIPSFIKSIPSNPVVAAFTATATENVRKDVINLLGLKNPDVYVTGFDRENLFFSVIKDENKDDFILKYIGNNKDSSGIIYAATRKEVDSLCSLLIKRGFSAGKYHAGMSEAERAQNQDNFLRDNINIIVATNAFGMGIDKSNVRYVIHYNMPKNIESYYQEAGRAGRDGEPSECILLFSPQDISIQKFMIEQSVSDPDRRIIENRMLQNIVDYCHTTKCLRKFILEYFGEKGVPESCDNCSNCKSDVELADVTIEAQMIFSCVLRMRQNYGINLVADVLKGSRNQKVLQYGFDSLSTYGLLKKYSLKQIKDLIGIFMAEDCLCLTDGEYPILRMTKKGMKVLKSREKIFQRIAKPKENKEEDNSLFAILKALRKEIADSESVPPYIIFADSSLHEMCSSLPSNRESFSKIKGVGEVKLEKYADKFIDAIQKYMKENNITAPKTETAEVAASDEEEKVSTYKVTYDMYKKGMSINEIAKARNLTPITIQNHIVKCGTEGCDVNWDDFINPEHESIIFDAIKKVGAAKLKPIKDILPPDVDYMEIRACICKSELK